MIGGIMNSMKNSAGFIMEMVCIVFLTISKAVLKLLSYVSGAAVVILVILAGLAFLIKSPYTYLLLSASLKLMIIAGVTTIICYSHK